jgi:hypothetical protein
MTLKGNGDVFGQPAALVKQEFKSSRVRPTPKARQRIRSSNFESQKPVKLSYPTNQAVEADFKQKLRETLL